MNMHGKLKSEWKLMDDEMKKNGYE